MSLCDQAGVPVRHLQPLEPWSFPGERALQADLQLGPCRDFNVMTHRGRWRAALRVLHSGAAIDAADATLLLAVCGRWRSAGEELQPMQALLWEAAHGPLAAEALDAGAVLLHVRLCHDRHP
jgi:environmental stress-induced protein Ves